MLEPKFPRCFRFNNDPPLFNGDSPWNQSVADVKASVLSQQQAFATHLVLSQFGMLHRLSHEFKKNSEVALTLDLKDSARKYLCRPITIGGKIRRVYEGGTFQNLQFAVADYTFPIYDARTEDGEIIRSDIKITNYDDRTSWEPPWEHRSVVENENLKCWTAHEVPFPPGEFRPGGPKNTGADGNIVLVDRKSGVVIDYWQATNSRNSDGTNKGGGHIGSWIGDSSVSAQAGAVTSFEIDGLGARQPGEKIQMSARASGLPYLGGCLLPEDLRDGAESVIKHAFAFSLPRSRFHQSSGVGEPVTDPANPPNFVPPATRTESFEGLPHKHALAAGQRIRLRDPIRFWDGREIAIDEIQIPITRIVCTALRDYGAILVDGSGGLAFYAEHKDTAVISTAQALQLTDACDVDSEETNWEFIIQELNADLSWRLFQAGGRNGGLPFGFMYETEQQIVFESNFEVL